MKTSERNGKKLRASILAGVLAAAMVLTGTFAWRSMSQSATNEIIDERNPGGRVHDDFNGLKNKDIYVENFTDVENGAPVFARVKLLEYMETGEDAGINRQVADRKATPLVADSYIDRPDTWQVYIPGAPDDKFREYWDWTMGGETVYLPTFNKNKDSLSVDVNGTYGTYDEANDKFEDRTPYDDYKTYTSGTAYPGTEYYDADDNIDDEYQDPNQPKEAPGGGGVETINYTKVENVNHTATETLNGLGIISMAEWIADGMPICNKWVYDVDGWFYWPEPILPQTATGLLLDKVDQRKSAGERSYYAIEVVGQFSNGIDEGNGDKWGDSTIKDKTDPKMGFYADGMTDNAKALLDKAASVLFGQDGTWYLPEPDSLAVFRQITGDEGKVSGLLCSGADGMIGTTDDRSDVEYVAGGIKINNIDYGKYYLKPTADEPFYRVNNTDNRLGTDSDTRFWLVSGDFPGGTVTTEPVESVTVASVSGATTVDPGNTLTFTANVQLNPIMPTTLGLRAAPSANEQVTWSVEGSLSESKGTTIAADPDDPNTATLTVASDEPGATNLVVNAISKLDNRVVGSATVKVTGKLVIVKVDAVAAQVEPTGTLDLRGTVTVDGKDESAPILTWTAGDKDGNAIAGVSIDSGTGKLTTTGAAKGTLIYVTASATVDGRVTKSAPYVVMVQDKTVSKVVTFAITGDNQVKAGTSATLGATVSVDGAEKTDATVTWYAVDNGGSPISGVTMDKDTGALSVDASVADGTKIKVVALTEVDGKNYTSDPYIVTVVGTKVVVEVTGGKQVKIGQTLDLSATVTVDDGTPETDPAGVTWAVTKLDGSKFPETGDDAVTIDANGTLHAGTAVAPDTVVNVTATYTANGGTGTSKVHQVTVLGTVVTFDITGDTEVKAGTPITLSAKVSVDGLEKSDAVVTWTATDGNNDPIDGVTMDKDTGALSVTGTVAEDTRIKAVASTVVDGKTYSSDPYIVTVVGKKISVSITTTNTEIYNGDTLTLSADVTVDSAAVTNPSLTWEAKAEDGSKFPTTGDTAVTIDNAGLLSVGASVAPNTKINVTASYTEDGKTTTSAAHQLIVKEKPPVTVTLAAKVGDTVVTEVEHGTGTTVSVVSAVNAEGEKVDITGAKWSVTTPGYTPSSELESLVLISKAGVLTIGDEVPSGTKITVKGQSTYIDGTAQMAVGTLDLTVSSPAKVVVTSPTEGMTTVRRGGKAVTFAAEVKNGTDQNYGSQKVIWELIATSADGTTITPQPGTAIDASTGKLTVDAKEPIDTVLTIVAKAMVNEDVKGTKTLTVTKEGYNLTAEVGKPFTVDDVEYRVLYKDDSNMRALVLRALPLPEKHQFSDKNSGKWEDSLIRTYLNGDYYNTLGTLQPFVEKTNIFTRYYTDNKLEFIETEDYAFLLSEADMFGTAENGNVTSPNARDYTVSDKGKLCENKEEWKIPKYSSDAFWLRTNCGRNGQQVIVGYYGDIRTFYNGCQYSLNICPAFWIAIQ